MISPAETPVLAAVWGILFCNSNDLISLLGALLLINTWLFIHHSLFQFHPSTAFPFPLNEFITPEK